MDKKNSIKIQGQTKNGTDNGNVVQGGRGRQSSGCRGNFRNDTKRNYGNRSHWDDRRNLQYPKSTHRQEITHEGIPVYDAADIDLESAFKKGGKKVNLNHLLNFTSAPIKGRIQHQTQFTQNKSVHRFHHHRYNKEQFLQANCQFVISCDVDLSTYTANPDALVDWDLIQEIRTNNLSKASCPICLHPPVAPKITRCGHIYCWACMLHYLALSDHKWRKCPICYDAVDKKDLKSVSAVCNDQISVGDKLSFYLMKREKGSTYSLPMYLCDEGEVAAPRDINQDSIWSKLILATPTQVIDMIVRREESDLKSALAEQGNEPEACFLEEALALLAQQRDHLLAKDIEKVNLQAEEIEAAGGADSGSNGKQNIYFYQACDGQLLYLNTLNIHMLEYEYGGMETCPHVITGRVLQLDSLTMEEELRRRFRRLQHLPLTSQFMIAEVELTPELISDRTHQHFRQELEGRRKQRSSKARAELRRERRIEEEENKKWGRYPSANVHVNDTHEFPACSADIPPPSQFDTGQVRTSSPEVEHEELWPCVEEASTNTTPDAQSQSTSFAKMLREGKTAPTVYRCPAPAWGGGVRVRQDSVESNTADDYTSSPPEFHASFSQAIQEAINTHNNKEGAAVEVKTTGKQKKKKKSGKQQLLFSTSMSRGAAK